MPSEHTVKRSVGAGKGTTRNRMAADELVTYIIDVLSGVGDIESARFFGGTGIKLGGTQFAIIMQGTLYLVVSSELREQFKALGSEPFSYATKHGQKAVQRYYAVPDEMLDDAQALCAAANVAFAYARNTSRAG